MKIIYIHQYFKTPKEPGGTRSYFVARELVNEGHNVTVIRGKALDNKRTTRESIDNIDVISVNVFYSGKLGVMQRLKSFSLFMWKALIILFRQKKVDMVIASSTPLTVGIPPLLYKKIKKVPYLFEVRDLWPEFPIQMGALKNPVLRKSALMLEKLIYKNAMHIVTLSPGMTDGVAKVLGKKEKITMIPNMAKIDKFWQREKNDDLRKELGLRKNSFKIIHFGAMGLANGLDYIIETAITLKEKKIENVEFIFLGDGSVKERLIEKVKKENLDNVFFYGRTPMDKTSEIVNICDASIVPFLDLPVLYTNSPNKLFDSLSAGLPLIVNSKGWTKDMVEKYNCGVYVDPNNPNECANIIIKWSNDTTITEELGKNARKLAENKYDKSILCKKFVKIVNSLPCNK